MLACWAVELDVAPTNCSTRNTIVDPYLYAVREDHAADLERQLEAAQVTTVSMAACVYLPWIPALALGL